MSLTYILYVNAYAQTYSYVNVKVKDYLHSKYHKSGFSSFTQSVRTHTKKCVPAFLGDILCYDYDCNYNYDDVDDDE